MRKGTIISTLALIVLVLPSASAHTMNGGGFLAVGHPGTPFGASVTEVVAPCNPSGVGDSVDGDWWNITSFGDGGHTLTLTPAATLDADAWFFTAQCNPLDDASCAQFFLGGVETCTVPLGAAFMLVSNFAGAGTYTFSIT